MVFIIWCCVKNCRLEREYNTLEEEIGSVVSDRQQQGQQEGEKEGEKEKV